MFKAARLLAVFKKSASSPVVLRFVQNKTPNAHVIESLTAKGIIMKQ